MRSPGCNIACIIRMLAAPDTSATVAAIVFEIVASGSTSVASGLTSGGGGGSGATETVWSGFVTTSGGVTGAGGGIKGVREIELPSTGRGGSLLVELSPLAATPA